MLGLAEVRLLNMDTGRTGQKGARASLSQYIGSEMVRVRLVCVVELKGIR